MQGEVTSKPGAWLCLSGVVKCVKTGRHFWEGIQSGGTRQAGNGGRQGDSGGGGLSQVSGGALGLGGKTETTGCC